jgi:hypothetical protein
MLHLSVSQESDPNDSNTNNYQQAAVISMALIAFGEDVGMEMSKRIINNMI